MVMVCAVAVLAIWNTIAWPRLRATASPHTAPRISVLIPARDEASRIGYLLQDLSHCDCGVLEILVYDDHSTDGTAQVIEEAARRDPRIRRLPPKPLPDGWRGKPFACYQLALAAQGEWLLFLDADVRLGAEAPARIIGEAETRKATLLSAWPGLVLKSFPEKWLMPLLNYVVFTLFPAFLSFRDRRPGLGLAHGACIACRAAEYRAMDGHAAVRKELFEDTRLAQAWRRHGGFGLCVDGQDLVRTRMYDSFGAIWRGFSKNLGPAFRRRFSFALFLIFHALLGVVPFLALAASFARREWLASPFISVSAVLLIRAGQAFRFRYPLWSVLLHPFAVLLMLALALVSRFRYETGGVEWKGRRYRKGSPADPQPNGVGRGAFAPPEECQMP